MNRKQKTLAIGAGVMVALAALLTFAFRPTGSEEYQRYASYMDSRGLPTLTEEPAREDAIVVCGFFKGEHVNIWEFSFIPDSSKEALVSGWCPEYFNVVATS